MLPQEQQQRFGEIERAYVNIVLGTAHSQQVRASVLQHFLMAQRWVNMLNAKLKPLVASSSSPVVIDGRFEYGVDVRVCRINAMVNDVTKHTLLSVEKGQWTASQSHEVQDQRVFVSAQRLQLLP